MKIIFDSSPENLESHARYLHREMLKKHQFPRINAVTRAFVPAWCDVCGERAWGPVIGGLCRCDECLQKDIRKISPGY